MKSPFDSEAFSAAALPMTEPVRWRGDKSPHYEGVFGAVVLHGAPNSTDAGHPYGTVAADQWTVLCPLFTAMASGIQTGDTLTPLGGETLTVQAIGKDASGWVFTCTANEHGEVR